MPVRWRAWGTDVQVDVSDPAALPSAVRIVARVLVDAERAADADRPQAQVQKLLRSDGRPLRVRPTLSALVATALDAAEATGGLVDPTVGVATLPLRRAAAARWTGRSLHPGTFPVCSSFPATAPRAATGWREVGWSEHHVTLPRAACLDLTATAKARTARLAAARVAERLGVGVVVELGGDVATAGPHAGSWRVRLRHLDDARVEVPAGQAFAACRAATVVDPASGRPVGGPWSVVAVTAPDVVVAKSAAVAALVLGEAGPQHLADQGLVGLFVEHARAQLAQPRHPR